MGEAFPVSWHLERHFPSQLVVVVVAIQEIKINHVITVNRLLQSLRS